MAVVSFNGFYFIIFADLRLREAGAKNIVELLSVNTTLAYIDLRGACVTLESIELFCEVLFLFKQEPLWK